MNKDSVPPLMTLARAVLEEGKAQKSLAKKAQFGVLALGVLAVIVQAIPTWFDPKHATDWLAPTAKNVAYACAIGALVLQVARWCLQRVGADRHALGNAVKRRGIVLESLGDTGDAADIRILRGLAGIEAAAAAQQMLKSSANRAYYASGATVGLSRLLDNLQESAFFSQCLYRKAATREFWKFGLTVVGLLIAVLLVALYSPRQIGPVLGNALLLFAATLVTIDQLGQAISWHQAAQSVERVDRRLAVVGVDSCVPYLAIFADYEAATAVAPAIPTSLYEKERDRLDAVWRSRHNQR